MSAGARSLGAALAALAFAASGADAPSAGQPVNYVEINARLATSGQPTTAILEAMKARGVAAVIYLAPPTVGDAVRDEPLILGRQGVMFVNIPVNFGSPTEADFQAFTRTLAGLEDRKVLVHCQVNLRASSFVFLHRVIHGREDPEKAWESVRRVWEPDRVWRAFILATLRRHQIAFEPI